MSGLICGIDPGISGAVGFLTERGEFVRVFDMPVYETTTGRRQIDPVELGSILMQQHPLRCVLERVNARPGEGAVGAFSFGHSLGVIQGVLGALGFPQFAACFLEGLAGFLGGCSHPADLFLEGRNAGLNLGDLINQAIAVAGDGIALALQVVSNHALHFGDFCDQIFKGHLGGIHFSSSLDKPMAGEK